LESLCSLESEQRFIIAIVELQGKFKRKRERNYGGGALSDALSGSGELIAAETAYLTGMRTQTGVYLSGRLLYCIPITSSPLQINSVFVNL
jgi:hypothetical protein